MKLVSFIVSNSLSDSTKKSDFEPLDENVTIAIDDVVDEINYNRRLRTLQRSNTNYELALNIFKEEGQMGVGFDQLRSLVSHVGDPDAAVRRLTHQLGKKLQAHGLIIRRSSRYEIVSLDTPSET